MLTSPSDVHPRLPFKIHTSADKKPPELRHTIVVRMADVQNQEPRGTLVGSYLAFRDPANRWYNDCSSTMETQLTRKERTLLRASFEAATRSIEAGNHPFGAVLADPGGQVLLTAENTVVTGNDATGHAETNLVRMIDWGTINVDLGKCTLYASTEPCPMCSGAIYWSGIGRVIFGLSQERFYSSLGEPRSREGLVLSCREVFMRGGHSIEVVGPALEDEAAELHSGFWT